MNEVVSTTKAPRAIGPYSQAVKVTSARRMLFASGQIPLRPDTGEMVKGSIEEEVRQVLENLRNVVEGAGFGMEHVVRTTIYLVDMADFPRVNEVYGSFFATSLPARATVAVAALPRGARVEIDAVCAD
jgi:2-iminobutanoate/2-iminopropanoate deaminase